MYRTWTGRFEVRLKHFTVSWLSVKIKGEAKHSTTLTSTGLWATGETKHAAASLKMVYLALWDQLFFSNKFCDIVFLYYAFMAFSPLNCWTGCFRCIFWCPIMSCFCSTLWICFSVRKKVELPGCERHSRFISPRRKMVIWQKCVPEQNVFVCFNSACWWFVG